MGYIDNSIVDMEMMVHLKDYKNILVNQGKDVPLRNRRDVNSFIDGYSVSYRKGALVFYAMDKIIKQGDRTKDLINLYERYHQKLKEAKK
jgi:hypothetical protein